MLTLTPAGLHITVGRPMGYSDHFGLRRIAEDQAHADRLAGALKASGGSLALSWLNLGEYATVTDREQRLQAERLIDRVLPAVFPLDVGPFEVHRRQIAAGPHPPHADEAVAIILTKTVESLIAASGVEVRLTASGVFDPLNHERLIVSKERLARITQEKLEGLRKEYATNPDFRRAVMRAERTPETASETNVLAFTRAMTATFLPGLLPPVSDVSSIGLEAPAPPSGRPEATGGAGQQAGDQSDGEQQGSGTQGSHGCHGNPTSAPPPVPVGSPTGHPTGAPVTHPTAGGCA